MQTAYKNSAVTHLGAAYNGKYTCNKQEPFKYTLV